jgi:hypothetical protein
MTNMLHLNQFRRQTAEIDKHLPIEQDLAPIVAIGGLLTIKQVADWYKPILAKDTTSSLAPSKRFIAPPQRGLGQVEDMREELTDRLEKLYDKLGSRKMLLVGHSLGGLMATMSAVERPEMVAGVVSLGGVHAGYDRETTAVKALRRAVGNPPHAKILRHDSDFMLEHTSRMAKEWPKDVPLHVISTPFDVLVVPPQGFGVELAHGAPDERLVIPPGPLLESAIRKWLKIPCGVNALRSTYPTEHINLPRNPQVANYIERCRRAIGAPAISAMTGSEINPQILAA